MENLVVFYGFTPQYCPHCLDTRGIASTCRSIFTTIYKEDNQEYVKSRYHCDICNQQFMTLEALEQ